MSELFTYGSVGRAPGNRCLYPEVGRALIGAPLTRDRYRGLEPKHMQGTISQGGRGIL
jgi:hypothetical protein